MANTPNYNLKKVEYTEMADIPGHFNANFDTIDAGMKSNADAAAAAEDNAKSHADGLIGTLSELLTTVKTNIVAAINSLKGEVDSHKAEMVSYVYTTTRDLSLIGEQVVTLPITPKAMIINSHVFNVENKFSIGMWSKFNNAQSVLGVAGNGMNFDYTTKGILIAENGADTTLGAISVNGNQLTINWTHTGVGATGTVRVRILIIAHGGA